MATSLDEDAQSDSSSESSGTSGTSEDEEPQEMNKNEIVNVDFEARTPEESDFAGIQRLLKQLLPTGVNLSDLTTLILSQSYVGAVVFQPADDGPEEPEDPNDDDEDIFGLTTMINLSARKDHTSIQDLLKYLKSKLDLKDSSAKDVGKFSDLFDGKIDEVGWIVNERFINLPSQIAPNLFESLRNDIEDAVKKSMPYKMKRYLLIAKAHVPKGGSVQNPVFVNDEEELFFQNSIASYSFSLEKEADSVGATAEWKSKKDKELFPIRIVMLLEPAVVDREIANFRSLFLA